jgi:hypothetical protein
MTIVSWMKKFPLIGFILFIPMQSSQRKGHLSEWRAIRVLKPGQEARVCQLDSTGRVNPLVIPRNNRRTLVFERLELFLRNHAQNIADDLLAPAVDLFCFVHFVRQLLGYLGAHKARFRSRSDRWINFYGQLLRDTSQTSQII